MQIFFSVVQKLWPHKAFKKTPYSLIGVKNSLQRKYGFMVLPEKVLRSRIRNKRPFQNTILLAWEITEKPLKFDKFYGMTIKWWFSVISQSKSMVFWNGLLFLILLLKTFSGSTMKPYFRCNEFLTPIRELGVFLKALCGHNFCTTEKIFCMGHFLAYMNHILGGGQNFINFFKKRDRLMYIVQF